MRVAWVVIGVALIGSLALFGQYRRQAALVAETAARQQYFPLQLEAPLVYRITKTLTRRILSEKFPALEHVEDAYFSRLSLENRVARRSDKCSTIRIALTTTSDTKEEALTESAGGVRLAGSGLLLCPPITTVQPVAFSLTFGLTRGGDGFFGWPLIEVIGMAEAENRLFAEVAETTPAGDVLRAPKADRQVLFNVMREETVRFFQSEGEELTLGNQTVKTVKLQYSGQLTRANYYHQIAGALWLAPKLGVVKETRQVVFKAYPPEELDPATNAFVKKTKDVVLYEAAVTKLLAHGIERG